MTILKDGTAIKTKIHFILEMLYDHPLVHPLNYIYWAWGRGSESSVLEALEA